MRTSIKILIASAAATIGLVGFTASPAMALAPAPSCDSGGSEIVCDATSSGTTTWSVTYWLSSPFTITTAGGTVVIRCPASAVGHPTHISYSYVSGGVTQTSATTTIVCRSGPWQ